MIEWTDFGDPCFELWSIAGLSAQLLEWFLVLFSCSEILFFILLFASLWVLSGFDLKWLSFIRRTKDRHHIYLLKYALLSLLFLPNFMTVLMDLGGFVIYEIFYGNFSLLFRWFVKEVMNLVEPACWVEEGVPLWKYWTSMVIAFWLKARKRE